MKNPNNLVFVHHMIDAIKAINSYVQNYDFKKFNKDGRTQDAVVRQLEILREAATKLSENFKNDNAKIPWRDAINLRHKLIHHYFETDVELVWEITQKDLPQLGHQLRDLI